MMSHFVYAPIRNVGIDIVPWLQQRRRHSSIPNVPHSHTHAHQFLISQNSYKPATLSRRQFPRNLCGMLYILTTVPIYVLSEKRIVNKNMFVQFLSLFYPN